MTRDEFMSRRKLTKVDVPGYGDYYFKTLSLEQALEQKVLAKDLSDEEAGSLAIAMRLCDEHGRAIEGLTYQDVPQLDAPVWFAIVSKMNAEKAETVEDAAKN
jgi:hypothetical protein